MLQFAHPTAFLLLLPLLLVKWLPRQQTRTYLAVSLPPQARQQLSVAAKPRWLTRLPTQCVEIFLGLLVILISEPSLATREVYDVKPARNILMLLDTSASMIQTGLLQRVVTGFLVHFIHERPPEDRLAVVRFDADASGGLFTRNHQGVIMEITRPSMMQQLDLDQDWALLHAKGTQLGIGLFKALTTFLEDEVETRLAEQHLDLAAQETIFHALQDELRRLLWHLLQKHEGTFPLEIPLVPQVGNIGTGKSLIVITDGQLLEVTSPATQVDYLKLLGYYEQLGFRHVYFVSLKDHPSQLNPLLRKNPAWKVYHWNQTHTGLQTVFTEIANAIDAMEYGKGVVAIRLKAQPLVPWFVPGLVFLVLAVGLRFHPRIRRFP